MRKYNARYGLSILAYLKIKITDIETKKLKEKLENKTLDQVLAESA